MTLRQAERVLNLTTPLGEDVLLLTGFNGHEQISRLFHFELEMISDDTAIQPPDIVGKNATFSVKLADDSPRVFNGFVSRFVAGGEDDGRRDYRAEVVPWLWFLTQTADCRIFQKKKIQDIVEQIFSDLGFSDYAFNLRGDHKEWEYCVQFRETDFNFVSRLLEQEGIFYWFKHQDGKHILQISDHLAAYEECPESQVDFPLSVSDLAITDHITSWEHRYKFCPGKWAQTDYNFQTPSTSLLAETTSIVPLPGISKYEVFDYPGEYPDRGAGMAETKLRIEEEEVGHDIVHASSQCKTFTPGGKFTIGTHHSSSEEGKTYLITSIRHFAAEPGAYETGGEDSTEVYGNTFACIPASVVFRPARITPKPVVSGVQTAVVVGPAGEEIYTDEYGRVKVHFHWDRESQKDEHSSCWIRVAQNWAGENWGIIFNPRIGQEVIVDFVNGDPDRPIIIGRVYNAEQTPPYALPEKQTQSTIKSRSSKGGGPDNFNELRFEDKMGQEEVYFHAERDFNRVVENDDTLQVGNDQKVEIANNQTIEVGYGSMNPGDQLLKVYNDQTLVVGNNQTNTIEKGDQTTEVQLGKSVLEALQKIELKVGASSLVIEPAKITLKSVQIEIKGDAMVEVAAPQTKVAGDAMLIVTGGIIKLN